MNRTEAMPAAVTRDVETNGTRHLRLDS